MLTLFMILALLLTEPAPDKAVTGWLSQAHVEDGIRHTNLILYPVVLEPGKLPSVLTMDEGLGAGTLVVSEVNDSGSVNNLLLENRGKQPVFIMAGEILDGAKQDRVLQHDLWLKPGSGKVDIGAYCVEHGRWSYESAKDKVFRSQATLSNIAVRAEARKAKSQGAVWDAVAATQAQGGYSAPTQSLNAAYESKEIQANVDSYLEAFGDLPDKHGKMNGVIVQIGDRIVAADCFSSKEIMKSLWPKMVKSYALEAVTRGNAGAQSDLEAARRFLLQGAGAEPTRQPTAGEGTLYELSSRDVAGAALVLPDGVAHLELFRVTGASQEVPPLQRNYRR